MRMCKRHVVAIAAALSMLVPFAASAEDSLPFASATEAYRQGIAALKLGETETALPALEYAAERGVLGAQLKLARIYAAGNGAKRDDAKAFLFYRQIADQRADISPRSPVAKYVAEAFVALGGYYVEGIPAAHVPKDPVRAAGLLRHAASYFGSADAQYALARLYLDGVGVYKNLGLAVNWLAMAAKKQHAAAQATLGELLWHGTDEIRQRPTRGLALIMLAHANAKAAGKEPKWIEELYREVQGASNAAMLKEAQNLIPELGGRVADLAPVAPPKSAVAEKLLLPAAGTPAPKTGAPAPAAAAVDAVASGEVSVSAPPETGVPLGFGPSPTPSN
ncbi:MAG: tetratricopeptide repeat protein [Methyloceanibacter sp.]